MAQGLKLQCHLINPSFANASRKPRFDRFWDIWLAGGAGPRSGHPATPSGVLEKRWLNDTIRLLRMAMAYSQSAAVILLVF
jgi:hypothetical protein